MMMQPFISHEKEPALQQLLSRFEPITLAEMADVSLQNRVDTKYIIGVSQLYPLLEQLIGVYRVLDIHQMRLNHYLTLYFDTPDFELYREHHNGLGTRYKVRARKYVDSNLSFFEIKHKTNQRRTIKSRMRIPDVMPCIPGEAGEFVYTHTPFDARQLEPKLWNDYWRVTFA
ncbi:MAG: polyphosphate polymerase domain-containing protein, partial [Anaerolineae bacterium]|nr:polyphosphate polymerase domain-containing protein [Anaerolineae bacterium]